MLRSIVALGLLASACAPAPPEMAASEASEVLARFAMGTGPANICTTEGRTLLRGAVRSYGAAMTEAGEAWPSLPLNQNEAVDLDAVEVAVLIAVGAGFVRASDLPAPARSAVQGLTLLNWSAVQRIHETADQACAEVADLHQAVGRYFQEMNQLQRLNDREDRDTERVMRQARRVERAMNHMNDMAARLEARVVEIQGGQQS